MLARIINSHWIELDQVFPGIEEVLVDSFSAKHPQSRFIDTQQQSWDGYYRKYDTRNQRLARPFLMELIRICHERDIPLDVQDQRNNAKYQAPDPSSIDKHLLNDITLEDHQVRSLHAACKHEIGIHKHPTGAGKTVIMAGIVKMFQCPTVIIAEKRIVIEQIKQRLDLHDLFDDGDDKAGLFYGGTTPDNQTVVVGSIQSLSSPPANLRRKNVEMYKKRQERAKQFQQIVSKADLLLIDECDLASTNQYRKLCRKYFTGRRIYGFSATPFDDAKPVANLLIREQLGSIIAESDRKTLEKIGRIIPIKYQAIAFGDAAGRKDRTRFDVAERTQLIDNKQFHKTVAKIVSSFSDERTLILVDTCNVEDLGLALEEVIPDSIFIYGKTSKAKRAESIAAFENGQLNCLIGGKILKRGLDIIGGVDNLILCGGGRLWSNFDQAVGRAVRVNERGWARVFDFFLLGNHYLYRHSKERLKCMVDMGYDAQVYVNGTNIKAADLIRRNFRLPK